MKRIILLLLCATMLLSLAPAVFAAGNASLSGPSTVRAGDTITLTFSAGGGIYGGSGSVSFDANQLTLLSWNQVIGGGWVVEFNETGNNFVFYDNSMANPINGSASIFQLTFSVASNLDIGTSISVSAHGVKVSDGKQDTSVGSCNYSASITAPLSSNAVLASLTVGNATLSPAFSPDVTGYSVSVPYYVSSLELSATAADSTAKVTVSNPKLIAGTTTEVTVVVTAENGSSKTYTIFAARAQDPNYVKSSNSKLKDLSAEGYTLSPAFSTDITNYYVWLPYEAESVSITGKTDDPNASMKVGDTSALLPGEPVAIPVVVTAEDGSETEYTITAFRAPAHSDLEAFFQKLTAAPTEPSVPTEPATEPTTALTTEPTTAPTTPPTTAPTTAPTTEPQSQANPAYSRDMLLLYILGGIVCASAGLIVGILVTRLFLRKKSS